MTPARYNQRPDRRIFAHHGAPRNEGAGMLTCENSSSEAVLIWPPCPLRVHQRRSTPHRRHSMGDSFEILHAYPEVAPAEPIGRIAPSLMRRRMVLVDTDMASAASLMLT